MEALGFKSIGGGWEGPHGMYYDDAEQAILTGLFGFCGCGCPESVILLLRDALQLCKDDEHWKGERLTTIFPQEGHAYLMWYLLDSNGFIEHGGCVPGWITVKGGDLLDALNVLVESYDEED